MPHVLLVLGDGPLTPFALTWAREAGLDALLLAPGHSPHRRLAHEFHPLDLGESAAALALARRYAREGRLASVLAAQRRALPLLAELAEIAPGVLSPRHAHQELTRLPRARLAPLGITTAAENPHEPAFEVLGSLRAGSYARALMVERSGEAQATFLPAALTGAEALVLEQRTAAAATALGLVEGPVQATWQRVGLDFALVELVPAWLAADAATHAARHALGKSPLQAWFAHLAGAGGPFDEMPTHPRAAIGFTSLAGRLPAELGDLGPVRRLAGVLEIVREAAPGAPRHPARLTLLVEGRDRPELESRLRRARAALEERIACKRIA